MVDCKVVVPIPILLQPDVIFCNEFPTPIDMFCNPVAEALNATPPIDMLLATLLLPLPTFTELIFKVGDVTVPSNVKSDSATIPPAPSDVST